MSTLHDKINSILSSITVGNLSEFNHINRLEGKLEFKSSLLGRLDLSKGLLSLLNVTCGIGKVVIHTSANTVLIKNVSHTSRQESKGSLGNTKFLTNGIVFIGEDGEVKSKFLGELLLRFSALSGDSDNICLEFLADGLDLFLECLGLDAVYID